MSDFKHPDRKYQEAIREAIRKIALKGIVDPNNGVVKGTGKIFGYVAKIHDNELDELYGTIDVQEYGYNGDTDEAGDVVGLHQGVYLTAIQNDISGYVIIPKLYSEVIVAKDSASGVEYVTMFSHVDTIQLDSHETITIGVTERQPFNDADDYDIHQLPPLGPNSKTTYTSTGITQGVGTNIEKPETSSTMTATGYDLSVAGGTTTMTANATTFEVQRGNADIKATSSEINASVGNSEVKVNNGAVYVGAKGSDTVEPAVMGNTLCEVLENLLDTLSQTMTMTAMGNQPFINLGQYIAMKAKISAYKASQSGLITSSVQIEG